MNSVNRRAERTASTKLVRVLRGADFLVWRAKASRATRAVRHLSRPTALSLERGLGREQAADIVTLRAARGARHYGRTRRERLGLEQGRAHWLQVARRRDAAARHDEQYHNACVVCVWHAEGAGVP